MSDATVEIPPLPQGRFVELDDGGTLLVREVGKKTDPPIILLHGWTATADLNWFTCFEALARHHRVIAFDHRGHGTGLRTRERFSLEACADDAVQVARALDVDRFIVVGYSMGGAVAQLVWRRHPEVVRGLVLCATASRFTGRRVERLSFLGLTGLAALARFTPEQARIWVTEQMYLQRKSSEWEPWAVQEASSHDWRTILEAGKSIGSFSSIDWLGEIDVPSSVLITMRDDVVPLERQAELFELIPAAAAFRIDGGHDSVVYNADRFVPTLLDALASVDARV